MGWIKIDRRITQHWLWRDAEKLQWFLDLLLSANYEERKEYHNGRLVVVGRGQLVESVESLARRWGRDRRTIKKFLSMSEEEGMIVYTTMPGKIHVITICNYERYQGGDDKGMYTTMDGDMPTAVDGDMYGAMYTNNKEIKNIICSPTENICSEDKSSELSKNAPAHTCEEDRRAASGPEGTSTDADEDAGAQEPEKVQDTEKVFADFVQEFNTAINSCGSIIPKCVSLTDARRRHLKARLREYGRDAVFRCVWQVARSDFLNGRNARGWRADLTWILKPENFAKILEGNYDNKKQEQNGNNNSKNRPDINDRRHNFTSGEGAEKKYESSF